MNSQVHLQECSLFTVERSCGLLVLQNNPTNGLAQRKGIEKREWATPSSAYNTAHIIWDILNLREEKEIKKPPKYQKNFLFDSDVKFPEFIIFGVKKCGTG